MSKKIFTLCSLVLLASASAIAHADTFYFATMPGATTSGGAVSAGATITTSLNTITINLHDYQIDPTDVAQLISGFQFTLSNGKTTGTLTSSSGEEVTINSNKTKTLGSTVSTGWALDNNVGGGMMLDVLGTSTAPEHLIIGPGPYTNSNGSIAGNDPHNPFLYETATFVLNVTGVDTTTKILTTQFSFGTTAGQNVHGVLTPEPGSLVLLGTGIVGLAGILHRRMVTAKQV